MKHFNIWFRMPHPDDMEKMSLTYIEAIAPDLKYIVEILQKQQGYLTENQFIPWHMIVLISEKGK